MKKYIWYGKFENKGRVFKITEPETPRHWYNYFFNDDFVSFTSQVGFGDALAQDDMGNRIPVLSNRNAFVVENGKFHSIFGLPMKYGYEDYACSHTQGSSEITLRYNGVKSGIRIFVPNEGKFEIWSVTLENEKDTERTLSLVTYARTEFDGTYRPQGYNLATGGFSKEQNAVYGKSYMPFYSQRNIPAYVFMSSSKKAVRFDSRRNAFIGPYGDENHPAGLEKYGRLQNSDCNSEKLCLALENKVVLAPGEKKTVHITVGAALSFEEFKKPTDSYVAKAFDAMSKKYDNDTKRIKISSPIKNYDYLVNNWLTYAADMGSRWARVRHNGYRDMTSDTECFAAVNPELAWKRIKRVLSYQYATGYAPRTIIDGAIRDRSFSDNTVWLTMAVNTIVKELGNPELLNEKVKFNNGEEATVYEHCKRSVEYLYNFQGLYGLIRIWGGDWNDCVNFAGLKGKGVSVWLTIAWMRANDKFREMAEWLGNDEDAKTSKEHHDIMDERIENYGYDKEAGYYIYARTDDDIIMGGKECDEGKIFLICQLWAVFAGLRHAEEAMEKVQEILEIPLGTRLAYPAYSYQRDYIGSMAEKAPGVQDNGGIYLHPSAWKLAADSLLGRSDRVETGLKKMLPFDTDYAVKCGEPYAMFNSYFAPETGYREGTPGQSWRTAASSWLLKSTVECIYGLHPEIGGLRIEPCLPASWKSAKISKVFRGCKYNIEYICDGEGPKVRMMAINGKPVNFRNNIVPPMKNGTLNIKVYVGGKEYFNAEQ